MATSAFDGGSFATTFAGESGATGFFESSCFTEDWWRAACSSLSGDFSLCYYGELIFFISFKYNKNSININD